MDGDLGPGAAPGGSSLRPYLVPPFPQQGSSDRRNGTWPTLVVSLSALAQPVDLGSQFDTLAARRRMSSSMPFRCGPELLQTLGQDKQAAGRTLLMLAGSAWPSVCV